MIIAREMKEIKKYLIRCCWSSLFTSSFFATLINLKLVSTLDVQDAIMPVQARRPQLRRVVMKSRSYCTLICKKKITERYNRFHGFPLEKLSQTINLFLLSSDAFGMWKNESINILNTSDQRLVINIGIFHNHIPLTLDFFDDQK